MKTVFMFPGQGSQSIGMMSELVAQYDEAKQVFEEASNAIDLDLLKIAQDGPEDLINSTEITQPIVMTASLAMWRVWQANTDIRPDFVCGHSLGEYTALVASGVFELADAVRLVNIRGRLMQEAVPMGQGGMAALMGIEDDAVKKVCEEAAQGDVVSAANFNSPGQVVISGATAALERAVALAKENGARRAAMLPVSVPCHCALLEPAGKALAEEMAKIEFGELQIPIVQNATAKHVSDLDVLKENLLSHLHGPVLWSQSIQELVNMGAGRFVECGPGKVLAGLNRRINKEVQTLNMNDTASMQSVLDAMAG